MSGHVEFPMTKRTITYILIALVALVSVAFRVYQLLVRSVLWQLTNGKLEKADYWRDEPVILAAGMGFDNIIALVCPVDRRSRPSL
jgi:hypothetical protein